MDQIPKKINHIKYIQLQKAKNTTNKYLSKIFKHKPKEQQNNKTSNRKKISNYKPNK
jgi:hypothetical protein